VTAEMLTKKTAPFVLVVVGVVVFGVLGPKWPRDQVLNVVLGDRSAAVEELRIRYAESGVDDWAREATFHYGAAAAPAPRVVHHEARLPDGSYLVEIEISRKAESPVVVRRQLELHGGGSTSVDVAEALAR